MIAACQKCGIVLGDFPEPHGDIFCNQCCDEALESRQKSRQNVGISQNPKDIAGSRKPPLHLVPPVANIHECMVLAHGAKKYGEFNWRTGPAISLPEYLSAMTRHILAIQDGEYIDPESNLPHLAHIRATAGILLDADSLDNLKRDFETVGNASELIAFYTLPDPTEIE